MPLESKFLTLADGCSLRRLDTACVYDKAADELYEVDDKGFEFLGRCDGTKTTRELGGDPEFVGYCLKKGIITALQQPFKRYFNSGISPRMSLRYLEIHITSRCNLRCRHCYLGDKEGRDLELMRVFSVFDQFDRLQGLRMLITGGEPMLHKGFWYINERLRDYGFSSVLLTNGSLINREAANRLKAHEAQVSVDGMQASHDALRGEGSFSKALQAIESMVSAGIKVAVATMATTLNKGEMDEMRALMESLGVAGWTVDAPSPSGRFKENSELMLPPEEAAPCLSYGFGGGHHGSPEGYACGAHLCAVGPAGQVAKCGFYIDRPAGDIKEGLGTCWERIAGPRLD